MTTPNQSQSDSKLAQSLADWEAQIDRLRESEALFRDIAASEKALFASLYLKTESALTVKERESIVYASVQWNDYLGGLSRSQVDYNYERHKLDLAVARHQAAYLELKMEHSYVVKANGF